MPVTKPSPRREQTVKQSFFFIFTLLTMLSTIPQQADAFSAVVPTKVAALAPPGIRLTWEQSAADLIRDRYMREHAGQFKNPYMVCVVGIPGSGKSTSTEIVADMLWDIGCKVIPFDGYHTPMKDLLQRPDALEAIYRRGAPDTFDAHRLCQDLTQLRYGHEPIMRLPGFDHAKGDPEPGLHEFDRSQHKIVIVEGLYLLHDDHGFDQVNKLFDYSVFIDSDVDLCMERLKIRNRCIPGYTVEEIESRVDEIDRANAMTTLRSKERADLIVRSGAL